MKLKNNQSALILETDENGEIIVEVISGDHKGITGALCKAMAIKLMQDVDFQEELMEMLDEDNETMPEGDGINTDKDVLT